MFSLTLRRTTEVANLQWQDIHHQTSGNPYIDIYQKGRSIKKLPLPIPLYRTARRKPDGLCPQDEYGQTSLKVDYSSKN